MYDHLHDHLQKLVSLCPYLVSLAIFPFRFHWRSTFFLFFAQTLMSPIFMTIVYQAIMVNIDKMAIMAIMAWLYMAMNMANIGVYSKTRKNVDQ